MGLNPESPSEEDQSHVISCGKQGCCQGLSQARTYSNCRAAMLDGKPVTMQVISLHQIRTLIFIRMMRKVTKGGGFCARSEQHLLVHRHYAEPVDVAGSECYQHRVPNAGRWNGGDNSNKRQESALWPYLTPLDYILDRECASLVTGQMMLIFEQQCRGQATRCCPPSAYCLAQV